MQETKMNRLKFLISVFLLAIPLVSLAQRDLENFATITSANASEIELIELFYQEDAGDPLFVEFSPDGSTVALTSDDGTLRLWNVETGSRQVVLEDGPFSEMAFSPDGKSLAIAGSVAGKIYVLDINSETVQLEIDSDSMITQLAISPDGSLLAAGGTGGRIGLWDLATGDNRRFLETSLDLTVELQFSADGTKLFSSDSNLVFRDPLNGVDIWDVAAGTLISALEFEPDIFWNSVAFSPDGLLFATGDYNGGVSIRDIRSGETVITLAGQTKAIPSLTFSHDGLLIASASVDDTIHISDVASGEQLTVLEGHEGLMWDVAFNVQGNLVVSAGDGNGKLRLWGVPN